MQLEMNFKFDTSTPGDESVMKNVCAVLVKAEAKTEVTKEKVVEEVNNPKEKIAESAKAEAAAPLVEEPKTVDKPKEEPAATEEDDEFDPATATDAQMMSLPTSVLLQACKEIGIDPDKSDGKNTNKKVRDLILAWQKKPAATAKADEEGEDDNDMGKTTERMPLSEARPIITPLWEDLALRPIIRKIMIAHGASKLNAANETVSSLGVLEEKGVDYRPMVDAIKKACSGK